MASPQLFAYCFLLLCGVVWGDDVCSTGGHTTLDDASRSVQDILTTGTRCDGRDLTRGQWYRFSGIGGNMIPETCPPTNRCRTHATAFLNGTHPTDFEEKDMTVCINWSGNCCYKTLKIKVRLCPSQGDAGNFYVYQLTYPEPSWCSFRYCTVNQSVPTIEPPEVPVATTSEPDPDDPDMHTGPPTDSNVTANFQCPDCHLVCPKHDFECPNFTCPDVHLACPNVEHVCPDCVLSCHKPDMTCPSCQLTCPAAPNVSCPACVCPECSVTCPSAPPCNLTCSPPTGAGQQRGEKSATPSDDTSDAKNFGHSTEVLGLAIALSLIVGAVLGALTYKLVSGKLSNGRKPNGVVKPPSSPRSRGSGTCSGNLRENQYDELLMLSGASNN